MLRRLTSIGMLMLAATGCASLRSQIDEPLPGDLSTPAAAPATPAQKSPFAVISASAPATPNASPIPAIESPSTGPTIVPTQATTPGQKYENLTTGPALNPMPPPFTLTISPKTGPVTTPQQVEEPIVAAFKLLLEDRGPEAEEQLKIYSPATRDFILRVMLGLDLMHRKGFEGLDVDDVATLKSIFAGLDAMVGPRAALAIPKLHFCDAITGFKIYHPLPLDHAFLAARGDRPGELVQLYMEMHNLGSRPDGGQFVTDLACEVEIVDEAGRSRWAHRFRPEDLRLTSQSRLLDYYHNFSFYLPASLTPGRYRLVVRLSDRTQPDAPRETTSAVPLHVVGDR
jgi:hypothetical protein